MDLSSIYKTHNLYYAAIIAMLGAGLASSASFIIYIVSSRFAPLSLVLSFAISEFLLYKSKYRVYTMQNAALLAIGSLLSFLMLVIMLVI